MQRPPFVGMDLVEYLRATFPASALLKAPAPDAEAALAALCTLVGQHLVIDHLEAIARQQERRGPAESVSLT